MPTKIAKLRSKVRRSDLKKAKVVGEKTGYWQLASFDVMTRIRKGLREKERLKLIFDSSLGRFVYYDGLDQSNLPRGYKRVGMWIFSKHDKSGTGPRERITVDRSAIDHLYMDHSMMVRDCSTAPTHYQKWRNLSLKSGCYAIFVPLFPPSVAAYLDKSPLQQLHVYRSVIPSIRGYPVRQTNVVVGITERENEYERLLEMYNNRVDRFGGANSAELFRMMSYRQMTPLYNENTINSSHLMSQTKVVIDDLFFNDTKVMEALAVKNVFKECESLGVSESQGRYSTDECNCGGHHSIAMHFGYKRENNWIGNGPTVVPLTIITHPTTVQVRTSVSNTSTVHLCGGSCGGETGLPTNIVLATLPKDSIWRPISTPRAAQLYVPLLLGKRDQWEVRKSVFERLDMEDILSLVTPQNPSEPRKETFSGGRRIKTSGGVGTREGVNGSRGRGRFERNNNKRQMAHILDPFASEYDASPAAVSDYDANGEALTIMDKVHYHRQQMMCRPTEATEGLSDGSGDVFGPSDEGDGHHPRRSSGGPVVVLEGEPEKPSQRLNQSDRVSVRVSGGNRRSRSSIPVPIPLSNELALKFDTPLLRPPSFAGSDNTHLSSLSLHPPYFLGQNPPKTKSGSPLSIVYLQQPPLLFIPAPQRVTLTPKMSQNFGTFLGSEEDRLGCIMDRPGGHLSHLGHFKGALMSQNGDGEGEMGSGVVSLSLDPSISLLSSQSQSQSSPSPPSLSIGGFIERNIIKSGRGSYPHSPYINRLLNYIHEVMALAEPTEIDEAEEYLARMVRGKTKTSTQIINAIINRSRKAMRCYATTWEYCDIPSGGGVLSISNAGDRGFEHFFVNNIDGIRGGRWSRIGNGAEDEKCESIVVNEKDFGGVHLPLGVALLEPTSVGMTVERMKLIYNYGLVVGFVRWIRMGIEYVSRLGPKGYDPLNILPQLYLDLNRLWRVVRDALIALNLVRQTHTETDIRIRDIGDDEKKAVTVSMNSARQASIRRNARSAMSARDRGEQGRGNGKNVLVLGGSQLYVTPYMRPTFHAHSIPIINKIATDEINRILIASTKYFGLMWDEANAGGEAGSNIISMGDYKLFMPFSGDPDSTVFNLPVSTISLLLQPDYSITILRVAEKVYDFLTQRIPILPPEAQTQAGYNRDQAPPNHPNYNRRRFLFENDEEYEMSKYRTMTSSTPRDMLYAPAPPPPIKPLSGGQMWAEIDFGVVEIRTPDPLGALFKPQKIKKESKKKRKSQTGESVDRSTRVYTYGRLPFPRCQISTFSLGPYSPYWHRHKDFHDLGVYDGGVIRRADPGQRPSSLSENQIAVLEDIKMYDREHPNRGQCAAKQRSNENWVAMEQLMARGPVIERKKVASEGVRYDPCIVVPHPVAPDLSTNWMPTRQHKYDSVFTITEATPNSGT